MIFNCINLLLKKKNSDFLEYLLYLKEIRNLNQSCKTQTINLRRILCLWKIRKFLVQKKNSEISICIPRSNLSQFIKLDWHYALNI